MEEKKQCTCCESREKKSTELAEKDIEQVAGGVAPNPNTYTCKHCGYASSDYYICTWCGKPMQ